MENRDLENRFYDRGASAVFLKTRERFGGLSNMAGGYPIFVNSTSILTSEALYQACRFPYSPNIQRLIISERSPMTAKMRSKPYRSETRADWDRQRVPIMRWCLRAKLICNFDSFSSVLLSTGDAPIVEMKTKGADFWGASLQDNNYLVGPNVLGRLLMELREEVRNNESSRFEHIKPLPIKDFLLFGEPIGVVKKQHSKQTLFG